MKISFCVSEDENLGVEILSHQLKKHGHTVNLVFNPKQFDKAYTRNEKLAEFFDWQKINLKELKKQDPDIIGFSCVTATYPWALEFAKKVKQEMNKPIIFGGVHPTLAPEVVMENEFIDMVCVGEAEVAILELAQSIDNKDGRTDIKNIWFRKNGEIIKNEVRDLVENLDPYEMDRELFFNRLPSNYRKSAYYMGSRGCPFNCTYCGNEQKRKVYAHKGRFVRQKSVDQVIKELQKLKSLGTKHILFVDDVLTMNREWFADFITRYKQEVGLPFTCFIHAKLFDEDLAKQLKAGGCKLIWYGIQTGSENVRKQYLGRFESDDEIIKAAKICKQFGLKFMVDHIFDIPYDNDVKESIRLYNIIRPNMINCYNLLYFPSSKIIDYALEAGIIDQAQVEKIKRGQSIVYQTGALSAESDLLRDNYSKYALLLTAIPILPQKFVNKVLNSDKWIEFFGKLPLVFIPMIKLVLNFSVGHGFIPLAVIKTELFWVFKFFNKKYGKQTS